jgi:hypothetical protein
MMAQFSSDVKTGPVGRWGHALFPPEAIHANRFHDHRVRSPHGLFSSGGGDNHPPHPARVAPKPELVVAAESLDMGEVWEQAEIEWPIEIENRVHNSRQKSSWPHLATSRPSAPPNW